MQSSHGLPHLAPNGSLICWILGAYFALELLMTLLLAFGGHKKTCRHDCYSTETAVLQEVEEPKKKSGIYWQSAKCGSKESGQPQTEKAE